MNVRTRSIASANKAAQNHAAMTRAAIANAAYATRDVVAPHVETAVHHAKRAGCYVGAFVRTLVGK